MIQTEEFIMPKIIEVQLPPEDPLADEVDRDLLGLVQRWATRHNWPWRQTLQHVVALGFRELEEIPAPPG